MKWIKNLFGGSRTEVEAKTKFSVLLNRCNVSRIPIGDKSFNISSRPGITFAVVIEMNEADVLTYNKLDEELQAKYQVDLYYNDVLKITNLRTGEIVKEKNIREYYRGLPEDEFIKLGF